MFAACLRAADVSSDLPFIRITDEAENAMHGINALQNNNKIAVGFIFLI